MARTSGGVASKQTAKTLPLATKKIQKAKAPTKQSVSQLNLNAEQKKKTIALSKRGVVPNRYADRDALCCLKLWSEVSQLLEAIGWKQLSRLNAPTYEELVYEFLSTFEFKEEKRDVRENMGTHTYRFKLMGQQKEVNEDDLIDIFGWDEDYDLNLPEFDEQKFWREQTMDQKAVYSGRSSKATSMVNPAYRYIYKLFAYSLFGRGSVGPISKNELSVIYCVHNAIKIDYPTLFGRRMLEVVKQGEGKIMVGLFVTMFAEHYKLLEHNQTDFTIYEGVKLCLPTLVTMRFARKSGHTYDIIPHERGFQPSGALVLGNVSQADPPTSRPNEKDTLENQVNMLEEGLGELKEEIGAFRQEVETQFMRLDEKLSSYFKSPPPSSQ